MLGYDNHPAVVYRDFHRPSPLERPVIDVVGVAAAAVILVMPAYVLHDVDFSRAVLIAEGVAVASLVITLMSKTMR